MKHYFRYFIRLIVIFLMVFGLIQCSGETKANQSQIKWDKIPANAKLDTATFAGGCFWCVEAAFEDVLGVAQVTSGYSGGKKKNPTYDQVSSGLTSYAEAVQILFDPNIVSYSQLLDIFWKNIDPTDSDGSFYDRGKQYRSVIFYHNNNQKYLAQRSKKNLQSAGVFDKPIVTQIEHYRHFYQAEAYHQNFKKTNPKRYYEYRAGSGRVAFFKKHWGNFEVRLKKFKKPSKQELKKILTPVQYKVTQLDGTETPFKNLFWDNKYDGIYVDVVSGEPLFSSTDKFKSGTGWPSFTKPISSKFIVEKKDTSFSMVRTEIRTKIADSHIGHVFDDGPKPTGLRYCMNSAAMRFIPKENLELEGYGDYLTLFK